MVGHSPDGKHVLLYAPETRYSAAYPVGTPDHIDIKPGSGGGFSQTNMNVDKSHLSDVLSGKGHPETTMVKGGAGAAEAVGGKGTAGGGEVPEAKPAVWDAHLTKAEVAEYQSLVKGVGPIMKNDLTDLIHNPNHVCNDPSALQKFVSKDIERAVAEAVKGIGKGDVSFDCFGNSAFNVFTDKFL